MSEFSNVDLTRLSREALSIARAFDKNKDKTLQESEFNCFMQEWDKEHKGKSPLLVQLNMKSLNDNVIERTFDPDVKSPRILYPFVSILYAPPPIAPPAGAFIVLSSEPYQSLFTLSAFSLVALDIILRTSWTHAIFVLLVTSARLSYMVILKYEPLPIFIVNPYPPICILEQLNSM